MRRSCIVLSLFLISILPSLTAQRLMEYLDRGIVAVPQAGGKVFVSWRLSATDPAGLGFNLYRSPAGGRLVKLNSQPLVQSTGYVDQLPDSNLAYTYTVKALVNGREAEGGKSYTLPAHPQRFLSIPLQTPTGYTPNDASVADLDGDGQYEIILHQTGRGRDNASSGVTDPPVFQAYTLAGKLLWTINLGKNIREGAHYTQFMAYDLDGDGRAELAMKTADGTIDGRGKVIGDSTKDWRNRDGKVLDGPEFFTIFDGLTGAALATTDYIPARGRINGWGGRGGNGGNDNSGNRVDRFTACVAYLDGKLPSVVMCRGYYGRTVLAAWDWRGGRLRSRWVFDSKDSSNPYSGMGNHNLSVADVDGDGKDEIIYGSMCVDDNGKGLYTTGLRHGDAIHVSDLDPSRPGEEVFGVHEIEERTTGPGSAMYDARTGEVIWTGDADKDVGRGVSADIDPRHPGAESWGGSEGLRTAKGERIGEGPRSVNFIISWDDDPLSELLNGTLIEKWDYTQGKLTKLLDARDYGCVSNNGTKANPVLSADILGDWREEVIYRSADNRELRIFSTNIPTQLKFYTFMHDPQYRLSIAWQNVGYNQPPHTSFFLGEGVKNLPKPAIVLPKQR
ncbi:MAG: rhamnogalacturonan lyase [Williamsia sp.]|nr:rhamnogalacturonan lyase [Williamsia sp.]